MNVLFVSHSFSPENKPLDNIGGMQRVAMDLFTALEAHPGVSVTPHVLKTTWKATPYKTVPFLLSSLWKIPSLVKKNDIQIVVFSSMVTAATVLPLGNRLHSLGCQLVVINHGQDVVLPFGPYQQVVPRIFDHIDAVAPVSEATGERCLERGLRPSRLYVIPNGIDQSRFPLKDLPKVNAQIRIRRVAGDMPEDALILLSVGRQVERKGYQWFVDEVMPVLPDNVYYLLAGDGPMGDEIRRVSEERGLGDRVRMLGRVSDEDLHVLYRGSDLFIMPNIEVVGDMEGFGVVLIEGGLSGLPGIAADIEGIKDVIEDGKNGHLVETGIVKAFKDPILHYLNDREGLDQLSELTRDYTLEHFTWPVIADRFVELFEELAESSAQD